MKYIEITKENKSNNPKLFGNYPIGDIYKKGLPNSYKGILNQEGGYKNSLNHTKDGWFDYIEPIYDADTEYLGDVFFDNGSSVFTRPINQYTQSEIGEKLAETEDEEADTTMQIHVQNGLKLIKRTENQIWRRRNKTSLQANKLTKGEQRSLMIMFRDVYYWLEYGNFYRARIVLGNIMSNNAVELNATQGMIDTANDFYTRIDTYFNSAKYKL